MNILLYGTCSNCRKEKIIVDFTSEDRAQAWIKYRVKGWMGKYVSDVCLSCGGPKPKYMKFVKLRLVESKSDPNTGAWVDVRVIKKF